jgi:hypothetical protein
VAAEFAHLTPELPELRDAVGDFTRSKNAPTAVAVIERLDLDGNV